VDLYAVSGILLLFLYNQIQAVIWRRILSTVVVLLVSLNILQFYQATRGVLPPVTITGEIYRDTFFNMSRTARVYIPTESITAKKTLQNNMESEKERIWMNQNTRNNSQFHTGQWSSVADIKTPYSAGLEIGLDSLFSTRNRVILVTAWVKGPDDVTKPSLIVDFQIAGKSLSYNHFELEKFVPSGRWTRIEVAYYVPQNLPEHGAVKIYFYNPSPYYKLYTDDLQIDFLSLKNEPDYLKMEGVNSPEPVR
ncbi:MAG: hypothetical protein WCJ95_21730, partial [Mariniphaga sp.]